MKIIRLSNLTNFAILASVAAIFAGSATAASINEIKVTLFGQLCLMQGPLDSATLKGIHAISPEQLNSTVSAEDLQNPGLASQIKNAIAKLNAQPKTPSELDRYREKVGKRLEALSALANGLQTARRQHQAAALLSVTKPYFRNHETKTFEALAQKVASKEKSEIEHSRETLDQLFDIYSEAIEPDPEEEFHRATRKLGIKYACSYEEPGDNATGGNPGSNNAGQSD